ncbi:MAG: hypothetical protein ACRD12_03740 [Acidimicrobiales bacterium]
MRNVFIPGTPLMLRDLGLAAYIPVLLPDAPATVDLPDEAALIAYPSRARYTHARQNSILGQLYTHTHLFVFDTSRSDGAFPEPLQGAGGSLGTFYCTGVDADWQADGDVVVWAGYQIADGFPEALAADVTAAATHFGDVAVVECIGRVSRNWAILWFLVAGFQGANGQSAIAELVSGLGGASDVLLARAERLIWLDRPPPVPDAAVGAWTYIFERDARHFMR